MTKSVEDIVLRRERGKLAHLVQGISYYNLRELQCPHLEEFGMGALCHDVGAKVDDRKDNLRNAKSK